jgi:hypothetical protein
VEFESASAPGIGAETFVGLYPHVDLSSGGRQQQIGQILNPLVFRFFDLSAGFSCGSPGDKPAHTVCSSQSAVPDISLRPRLPIFSDKING